MPGAWTAGVRTRPKAVRVIRERERRDKWQSVSSWMRIGAPYRCHSFVCGHTLSCDGEKVLPLLRWNVGFFGYGLLSFLPCRSHRVWECDSPWILGDVLTAGWRAIVLPLCLQFTFFSLSPLFSPLSRTDRFPFHLSSGSSINERAFSRPWWTFDVEYKSTQGDTTRSLEKENFYDPTRQIQLCSHTNRCTSSTPTTHPPLTTTHSNVPSFLEKALPQRSVTSSAPWMGPDTTAR